MFRTRSRKHECIADTRSIKRSAIACKTDTEGRIVRDYPVIRRSWSSPRSGDSSNIGNCHFIRRKISRRASVRLSFSRVRLLRHTIVSNEERMAAGLVERVLLREGLRENVAGGG